MCWNQHVSLNTFAFSAFMLGLLAYNNSYTPYKIKGFNPFYYFFILSFISMQFIEFFLWRNLTNVRLNHLFSSLGQILVTIQPVAALTTLNNVTLKSTLLTAYAVFVVFLFSKYGKHQPNTKVYNGHLQWNWAPLNWVEYVIWLAFLSFALVYNGYIEAVLIALVLLVISYYSYSVHRTAGSLWCWSINLSMLAYAVYLLVILPFREHGVFC